MKRLYNLTLSLSEPCSSLIQSRDGVGHVRDNYGMEYGLWGMIMRWSMECEGRLWDGVGCVRDNYGMECGVWRVIVGWNMEYEGWLLDGVWFVKDNYGMECGVWGTVMEWSRLCGGRLWDGVECVKDSSEAEIWWGSCFSSDSLPLNLMNLHLMKYLCVLGEVTSLSPQQLLLVYVTHLLSTKIRWGWTQGTAIKNACQFSRGSEFGS